MWELNHRKGWAPKNWCFQIVVLEKTLESPLNSKEIKPVNPKGNQPWLSIGCTDAEAEAPVLWPPDVKSQFMGKYLDTRKDWGQEEKGVTEDEMVGWHHWLSRYEFEKTLGDVKDREAWCAVVCGVTKIWTWLSNWPIANKIALPNVGGSHQSVKAWIKQKGWPSLIRENTSFLIVFKLGYQLFSCLIFFELGHLIFLSSDSNWNIVSSWVSSLLAYWLKLCHWLTWFQALRPDWI